MKLYIHLFMVGVIMNFNLSKNKIIGKWLIINNENKILISL